MKLTWTKPGDKYHAIESKCTEFRKHVGKTFKLTQISGNTTEGSEVARASLSIHSKLILARERG